MTSSDPAPPPQDVPLLQGSLHPGILALRLLDGLRSALFPLLIGVVVNRWFLVVAGVTFLLQVGAALVRYLTFHYTLTRRELRIREGILERQERRIPIDRVQDLGFEATLLRRLLGITVVSVETASGKGAEAVLDSLGRADAEQLRELLLHARQQAGPVAVGAAAVPPPVAEPEWTVFTVRSGDLLLRGLTDLRFGAVLVTGFAALEVADRLGVLVRLRFAADSFFTWLHGFPLALVVLMLGMLVACVLGVSVLFTAIGNLMAFHGFALTLRGDTLLARYGLLTRRHKTLPRARVQRVTVEQTWLRRLLDIATVAADSAGSGRGEGELSGSGFDVVVPIASLPAVEALLPALLPGSPRFPAQYRRVASRLVARTCLKATIWTAFLLALGLPAFGVWALPLLALIPTGWVVGQLAYGNLGWSLAEAHLFLRFGLLGRYQAVVPTGKVQAVVQRQGPLQRVLGLTDLTVYVAGGSPTRLPDLTRADAALLQAALADRARQAAAGEWVTKLPLPRRGAEA